MVMMMMIKDEASNSNKTDSNSNKNLYLQSNSSVHCDKDIKKRLALVLVSGKVRHAPRQKTKQIR